MPTVQNGNYYYASHEFYNREWQRLDNYKVTIIIGNVQIYQICLKTSRGIKLKYCKPSRSKHEEHLSLVPVAELTNCALPFNMSLSGGAVGTPPGTLTPDGKPEHLSVQ